MTITWLLEYKADTAKRLQLSPGQDLTLGRDFLPNDLRDRKISRQQLHIKATNDDLEVILNGSNPSCFKRENGLPQFVPKSNPVKLHNGDSLFIILDEHEILITKFDDEDTIPLPEADLLKKVSSNEINATETILSQFSPSTAKKRKIENISSDLDSESTQREADSDNNILIFDNSPPKKQKIEHEPNNIVDLIGKTTFDESLIASLLSIVPAITRDIAIRALETRNGNMELAVNDLLDQYLRNSPVKIKQNIKNSSINTKETVYKPVSKFEVKQQIKSDLATLNQFKEAYRLNKIKYSQEKDNITLSQLIEMVDNVETAILTTYKIQMDWVLEQCPSLMTVPEVVIAHGDIVMLIKPYVPQYGCPHGKIMLLFGTTHLLVVISTGNLIEVDYERKTNGLWYQVFPLKTASNSNDSPMGLDFKSTLLDYVVHLGISKAICNRLHKYCFDEVVVRLITSVPGTHTGAQLDKYGHTKLRKELSQHVPAFSDQNIYCQLSSIGSVDDKWIQEFSRSCTGGNKSNAPINVIWPSYEFVKNSVDGFDAGGSLCLPGKNLKPAIQKIFQKYQPRQAGRTNIPPHIKTFLKLKNGSELEWLCLTSANFSKAAWGVLQKNGAQLTINNFEIGVLFLPSLLKKSLAVGTELNISNDNITLPIPYNIPAPAYGYCDKPWTWDDFPRE